MRHEVTSVISFQMDDVVQRLFAGSVPSLKVGKDRHIV